MNILNWKTKLNAPMRNFWSSQKAPILKINGFKLGKQEKAIDFQEQSGNRRSKPLNGNQTLKELELIIFGDSITKYITPENICKCDP